ncbi:MAG: Gfo/Idh/MocA family oxidoreductase, partial [Pirellulaceae bacterium]
MIHTNRRRFLKSSLAVTASTLAAPAFLRARNLNSRIRVVVVGMGGRSAAHAQSLVELEQEGRVGVELAGVCDCDQSKLHLALRTWSDRAGHRLTGYDDMRQVFDDRSVDAVTFATPNHWHALNVIWGCQAGKDVYVEKPGSHNIFEGR